MKTFDGSTSSDVKKFFFFFDNVVTRGKPDEDKATELLSHLDGRAFDFFYEKFAEDGGLKPSASNYKGVKKALIDEFDKPADPQDDIRRAVNASIDPDNLTGSLRDMDRVFAKAMFNDEAKFGLLRNALCKIPEIFQFVVFKGATTYHELTKVVQEFDQARRLFNHQVHPTPDLTQGDVFGSKRVLNRPDARGAEIESKVDALAASMADLTLFVRKKTEAAQASQAPAPKKDDKPRICSFCKEEGHAANRCNKNPHRDSICERCGKMGHATATCWSRPKAAAAPAPAAPGANPVPAAPAAAQAAPPAPAAAQPAPNQGAAMVVAEGPDLVAAAKRTADGEALPKQSRSPGMDIDALLNPSAPPHPIQAQGRPNPKKKVTFQKAPKKAKRTDHKKVIQQHVGAYDVISQLANAPSGLTFGQLMRGDSKEAEKELRRLFTPLKARAAPRKASKANPAVNPKGDRVLKVVPVQIYGTSTSALLDTGAVPNLISEELAKHLKLNPKPTLKTITVADGSNSSCIGRLRQIPVTFGRLTVHMDFLTVKDAPLGVIIGAPALEHMSAVMDLAGQFVDLTHDGTTVRVGLEPDQGQPFTQEENSESELFTTDSSGNESDDEAEDTSEEDNDDDAYVVALAKEAPELPFRTSFPSSDEDESLDRSAILSRKLNHLPPDVVQRLNDMLRDKGICAWSFRDLQAADVPVRHDFELTDDAPIYHNPRRASPRDNTIIRDEIDKMLKAGIIKPATSSWSFPVVIATKKDGKPRFCVDYRMLNQRIKPSRWPIPHIEEIFDELKGSRLFTTLDLFQGYWQVKMAEACKEHTTFVTRYGTFSFEVMPFGLINAPATFQKMMDHILRDLPFARAYLDDVVIHSKTLEEHLEHLQLVFERLRQHQLKLRVEKCSFCSENVELLGHVVTSDGVKTDPKKIEAVREAPVPQDRGAVRSFLGLAGYYRRFIRDFAGISAPLHAATSTKVPFAWTKEAQNAFSTLKNALTSAPLLAFPDFEAPFIVETDASATAVGAILAQKQDGLVHPIQYASRTLNDAERNYSACEREALAVIFALRKFRIYLLSSQPFELITDHQALRYAFMKKDVHGRLARWLDFLAEYDFHVVYRPGTANGAADFLSRQALEEPALGIAEDDGQVAMVTLCDERDLEPFLVEIKRHLRGEVIHEHDPRLRRGIRRASKSFLVWNDELFRRTPLGPKIVLPKSIRTQALEMFHDRIGHWNSETSRQFVVDRYWWPKVTSDVYAHVKTCVGCQRAAPIPKYRTSLRMPITGLFHTFSIDFAGPLPLGPDDERYLLIAVEHLTSWPMVRATKTATADIVAEFLEKEILHPFGPPETVVSDNANCFTAARVSRLMEAHGVKWKTVAEYAPMSNGRAERMVGTVKKAIAKTLLNEDTTWVQSIPQVLYGYRRRRLAGDLSPFQLMYGVVPRFSSLDPSPLLDDPADQHARTLELFAIQSARAGRDLPRGPSSSDDVRYSVGDQVMVAKGRAFGAVKLPVWECKWFGPCVVETALHPRYTLRSSNGKITRRPIHGRRLRLFHRRGEEQV